MPRIAPLLLLLTLAASILLPTTSSADEPAQPEDTQAKLFEAFTNDMKDVALIGSFTIVGQENKGLKPERYEIKSVRKLDEGDLWVFNARIKYGDHDVQFPIPLEVKWAGKTPVITLDQTTIPGLGTFSSHVVIDGDKYAGTWMHGPVGGHLFGRIEKLEKAKAPAESSPN
ncbi:hypothetical protein [Bremerella cremea]|uniref:hypothetical protein n=1 Tax=Bremerella cremea TaxID=1031537 RepID=UPI0031F1B7C6